MPELTAELIVDIDVIGDPQVSPDGRRVAYILSPGAKTGDRRESHIWVVPADGSAPPRQWTGGTCRNEHARWSPDGTRLAFLSDRSADEGAMSIHVIPIDGGEATRLTTDTGSITGYEWSPDGSQIAFLAPDKSSEDDERRKKEKDDADVWGDRLRHQRAWLIDAVRTEAEPTLLMGGARHIHALAWSQDGNVLAASVRESPDLDRIFGGPGQIISLTLESGEEMLITRTEGGVHGVRWSPDGKWIVYLAALAGLPGSSLTVHRVPATGGASESILGGKTFCVLDLTAVAGSGRLAVEIAQGLDTRLEWLDAGAGTSRLLYHSADGDFSGSWSVQEVMAKPVVVAAISGPDRLRQIYSVGQDGRTQLTAHNTELAQVHFRPQQDFFGKASDGTALDGILIEPPATLSRPWATIVLVHGGPYARTGRALHLSWGAWGQWLAAAGYCVLMPNYRGGLGRGEAFAADSRGGMGGNDWTDVEALLNEAVAEGIADPDRLGIGGWSQGGFMTAWAVTQTGRFKAGVDGAGPTDWGMMTVGSDLPEFETALGGSKPWDGIGPHRHNLGSPISFARNATTPLLILHGEKDARVPLHQAWAFHRAMRDIGVPVEMVVYPREPHGLQERNHQLDVLNRVRGWFLGHIPT